MNEYEITLAQVRNKIRIYRTTYAQELKKMENNKEYVPKLSWFTSMHRAFYCGKVKSFIKTPKKEIKKEPIKSEIEIEFQEESDGEDGGDETQYEIKKIGKIEDTAHQHIIIEPYEEDYEVEEPVKINATAKTTSSSECFGMQSNELFLKSLQTTLDKLPDDKNMRARIKIQEILYQIAYDK